MAHQTPLSMKFSRQEYWSGLPFPSPEDLPDPGTEPTSPSSFALAGRVWYFFKGSLVFQGTVCRKWVLQDVFSVLNIHSSVKDQQWQKPTSIPKGKNDKSKRTKVRDEPLGAGEGGPQRVMPRWVSQRPESCQGPWRGADEKLQTLLSHVAHRASRCH